MLHFFFLFHKYKKGGFIKMAKPEIINDIDSKAPLVHNHSVDDITGTLPVSKGGTGTTSLSSLASSLNSYISSGC